MNIQTIELLINNEVYKIPNWEKYKQEHIWNVLKHVGTDDNISSLNEYSRINDDFRLEWSNINNRITSIMFNEESAKKITLIDDLGNRYNVKSIIDKMKILGIGWLNQKQLGNINIRINCKFNYGYTQFNCVLITY